MTCIMMMWRQELLTEHAFIQRVLDDLDVHLMHDGNLCFPENVKDTAMYKARLENIRRGKQIWLLIKYVMQMHKSGQKHADILSTSSDAGDAECASGKRPHEAAGDDSMKDSHEKQDGISHAEGTNRKRPHEAGCDDSMKDSHEKQDGISSTEGTHAKRMKN